MNCIFNFPIFALLVKLVEVTGTETGDLDFCRSIH